MRMPALVFAALAALAAPGVQMASQPWTTNRIHEAEVRLSNQIAAATNAIPAPDYSTGNAALVATIEATAPAPDFSTNNAALVSTIEAKAPAPGNYASVSNAAMTALQPGDVPPLPAKWAWSAVTNANGEAVTALDILLNPGGNTIFSEFTSYGMAMNDMAETIAGIGTAASNYTDSAGFMRTNAQGRVQGPLLSISLTRYSDAAPDNILFEATDLDELRMKIVNNDEYRFTPFSPYGTPSSIDVMRRVEVDASVADATNALAQSIGGVPAPISAQNTVPWHGGLVELTVASGATLAVNSAGWPNGGQVLVDATLPATYTVANGISPVGYSTLPSDGEYLMVITRLGSSYFISVISTVEAN